MSDELRARRAEERRARAVLVRTQISDHSADACPISGEEALSLATQLTRHAWAMAGLHLPSYSRHDIPIRFVDSAHRD